MNLAPSGIECSACCILEDSEKGSRVKHGYHPVLTHCVRREVDRVKGLGGGQGQVSFGIASNRSVNVKRSSLRFIGLRVLDVKIKPQGEGCPARGIGPRAIMLNLTRSG